MRRSWKSGVCVWIGSWLIAGAASLVAQTADPLLPPETPIPTDPALDPVPLDPAMPLPPDTGEPPADSPTTWQMTGTDPRNFERQKTITLRDGRTVEHTYSQSWDGTTLQRDRTFNGPNGQTHEFHQTWTAGTEGTAPASPAVSPAAGALDSPVASRDASRPKMTRPTGFTMGAKARGSWGGADRSLTQPKPGRPEIGAVRPHWKAAEELRAAGRPQVSRPNFSPGRNR